MVSVLTWNFSMIVAYSCTSTMSEKSDGKVDCICCNIKLYILYECSRQNLQN